MNLLDFLFPKRCVGCGKVGRYFCKRCTLILPAGRHGIRIIELNEAICPVCEKPAIDGVTHPRCQTHYTIDGLTSFFHYDGAVRQAIKSIKYRYVSDLAKEFVDLIPTASLLQLTKLLNSKPLSSLLIPIPLHSSRLRYRGFNQAEVLGSLGADRLKISMRKDILLRVKKTTPQVEVKDRAHRLKNMDGVFGLQRAWLHSFDKTQPACADRLKHENVKRLPTEIFLFDDVFTTGATMRAAASILKRAGVSFVWGITMAR